ncbi:hypothetical protein J2T13_005281 [Paenibacillus sp. DS2015]|uniref:hypothetical protein n=1 Tax=Paenibacillus sp. DS2015 TaxID=3373917 RepID=UPI003D1B0B8E
MNYKRLLVIGVVLLVIFGVYKVYNSDYEFGKFDSFDEALEKGIPYSVDTVVYTEKVNGVTIVMYLIEPDKKELPFADYHALAVAFFEGNDDEGWENVGPNGWTHYENKNFTLYHENLYQHDNQGNKLRRIDVTYGEVNDADVVKVEVKDKSEEHYVEARIITSNNGRYYFSVSNGDSVRALGRNGHLIDQQG